MDSSKLVERVQELTDVELAILLSLIADQHCIIKTEEASSASLEEEIQLVCSRLPVSPHPLLREHRLLPMYSDYPTLCSIAAIQLP